MKTAAEHLREKCTGLIETITISELRKSPGECLVLVEAGVTFQITRNGKPAAILTMDCGGSTVPGRCRGRELLGGREPE